MAIDEAEEETKRRYFDELAALDDSSDEEEDKNDLRDIFRKSKKLQRRAPQRVDSVVVETPPQPLRTPQTSKVPELHRTTSAPVSSTSFVKETPPISRKSKAAPSAVESRRTSALASEASVVKETPPFRKKSPLHISETITLGAAGSSIIKETPPAGSSRPPAERSTASDPTIGSASLSLSYSVGITAMLSNNRKRTSSGGVSKQPKKKALKTYSLTLVPENERIFKGQTFYWIPNDDTAPRRKIRITRAREYGAIWTTEFTPNVTHIVVETNITYQNVIKFLGIDKIPEGVILVNDQYPLDCIQYRSRSLLNPLQQKYYLGGQNEAFAPESAGNEEFLVSDNSPYSLQVKGLKSGRCDPNQTPPHSRKLTQVSQVNGNGDNSRSAAAAEILDGSDLVESPQGSPNGAPARTSPWYDDELNECIAEAKATKHLPVNDKEDDLEDDRPSSRDEPEDSGTEDDRSRPKRGGKKKKKGTGTGLGFNKATFQCMNEGKEIPLESNPNRRTIEILQEMAEYYIRLRVEWKPMSYRRAITTLKKQTTMIATFEQAYELPFIGERIAAKIEEIVLTNGLRQLDYSRKEPGHDVLQLFIGIYGVGISQAWKWVQQGHKTLDDLKEKVHLTDNQRVGIEHYDDLRTRIPRDEVIALGVVVKEAAAAIDPLVEVTIGGSFRRGAVTSGDIDCLITKPGTDTARDLNPFLHKLVDQLTEDGFLVRALAVPSEQGSGSKWHGCCVLHGVEKPIWRRIDFLLVPETGLGAALIYFTGDDIFNRSLRLLASRKGWRLNQRGLYRDVLRGSRRVKMTEGSLIEGADEKKIFAALGVPWRPPNERIYS